MTNWHRKDRYINAEDFLEWLEDEFKPGENGAVDTVCSLIEDRIKDMPYLTDDGEWHDPADDIFREEDPQEKPDPFEDFLRDEMLEDEWRD